MKTRLGKLAAQNSRSLAFAACFVAAVVIASVISTAAVFAQEKVAPQLATGFDSIKAEMHDGMLQITLCKTPEAQPRKIAVQTR